MTLRTLLSAMGPPVTCAVAAGGRAPMHGQVRPTPAPELQTLCPAVSHVTSGSCDDEAGGLTLSSPRFTVSAQTRSSDVNL